MNVEQYFGEAQKEATKALCLRDKCGAVVVKDGVIVGRGYNGPPQDNLEQKKCLSEYPKETKKPKSDRTCCMHAEWRAIIDALKHSNDLKGASLYFARVNNDGTLLPSGEPYCTVCSRLALDVGITHFCLSHEKGSRCYDTNEYNDLSYEFHQKLGT